jgi:phosphatidylglycerophosphate synthase
METKTQSSLWTAANLCTVTRVALLPLLVPFYLSERFILSFLLILLIGLSDIFDGRLARRTNTASTFGAIMDVSADCLTIFVIQGFLLATGDWQLYLLLLSLLSIATFSVHAGVRGRIAKTRFGRYTGAVLVTAFLVATLCKAIQPSLWTMIAPILCPLVGTFLMLSIVENLRGLFMVVSSS